MDLIGAKVRRLSNDALAFRCPGCKEEHVVTVSGKNPIWTWNGSLDAPTFNPSVLVTSGHYVQGEEGKPCWCTYNAEHPDKPAPFHCFRCHSFVRDGRIQFLSDCMHELAGQTVNLPDVHTTADTAELSTTES